MQSSGREICLWSLVLLLLPTAVLRRPVRPVGRPLVLHGKYAAALSHTPTPTHSHSHLRLLRVGPLFSSLLSLSPSLLSILSFESAVDSLISYLTPLGFSQSPPAVALVPPSSAFRIPLFLEAHLVCPSHCPHLEFVVTRSPRPLRKTWNRVSYPPRLLLVHESLLSRPGPGLATLYFSFRRLSRRRASRVLRPAEVGATTPVGLVAAAAAPSTQRGPRGPRRPRQPRRMITPSLASSPARTHDRAQSCPPNPKDNQPTIVPRLSPASRGLN